jgi:hypothetical protein
MAERDVHQPTRQCQPREDRRRRGHHHSRKFRADLPILFQKSTMLMHASPFFERRTPDRVSDTCSPASNNTGSDDRNGNRRVSIA